MGIKRDFTQNKIDELNTIVDYYENDEQWEFFDWTGDILAADLNVSDYLNELEVFHENVIDKHDIYKEDFQQIINNVEAVDEEFSNKLSLHNGFKESVGSRLQNLVEAMQPSMLTMPNTDFNTYISKPEVNDKILKGLGLTREEYDRMVKSMCGEYGFSENDIFLLIKSQYLHSLYYKEERAIQEWEAMYTINGKFEDSFLINSEGQVFFKYLSSLCTNYGGGLRWNMVGEVVPVDDSKEYFKKIGLTDAQVNQLFSTLNKQHNTATNNHRDFMHEMVAITIFSNNNMKKGLVDFISSGQIDLLSSVKGDIYSGRFGLDDMISDTDIINIFNRMKEKEDDYWKIYIEYNIQVNNGEINRAEEFLINYGDGDIEKGIAELRSDIESWSLGGDYIQGLYRDENERLTDDEKVQNNLNKYLDYLSKELNKK